MKKIHVSTGGGYDVVIGRSLLRDAGGALADICADRAVMIVSDDIVSPLYGDSVTASLRGLGCRVCRFTFAHGEASKSVGTLARLWEELAEAHITRSDVVLALGGGVTGDLAGFAASTYLRGVTLVQAPTTLLAMTDSSVGGKTAVDLTAGKNLAGTFYQPSRVLCDPDALLTLPGDVLADGMAEVVKYGMINRPALLTSLGGEYDIADVIALCVEDKRDIVEADERDTGARRLLNLGHTVAHGIELCSGYTVSHGRAVAAGMCVITRAAVAAGICEPDAVGVLEGLLERFGLPTRTDYSAAALARAAMNDKKRSGDTLTLVVPVRAGRSELMDIRADEFEAFIGGGL